MPITGEQFDALLALAERKGLSPLQFLHAMIGEQANLRRERSIARRIHDACFREPKTLLDFDWEFNKKTIDRAQIEELATGEFIRRHDNWVLAGQSGTGKSHIVQAGAEPPVCLAIASTTSPALISSRT